MRLPAAVVKKLKKRGARGSVTTTLDYLWPNATIYYSTKHINDKKKLSKDDEEKTAEDIAQDHK